MSANPTEVVLASSNKGKIAEIQALLSQHDIRLRGQDEWSIPSVNETGSTFVENALLKARHASQITGLPALADDSGLMVSALNNAPGVRSARYAGEQATDRQNLEAVITALQQQGLAESLASFVCIIVTVRYAEDPLPGIFQGVWQGKVVDCMAGDQGFGYDPIFIDPELNQTAAQLPAAIKNQRSHRAQALAQLTAALTTEPLWY